MKFVFVKEEEKEKITERIKELTKSIVNIKLENGKALTDDQRQIGNEIGELSFQLFCKRKLENKSFTVCSNSFLRNIQIGEDDPGIPEKSLSRVYAYFRNNVEAFSELSAQFLVSKTAKDYKTDNQLFYVTAKSKYTSKFEDVFFINKRGQFIVFIKNITDIELEKYIDDYFGKMSHELLLKIERLKGEKQASHEEMQRIISDIFIEHSEHVADGHEFQAGAISFFDFLGWKGMWLNNTRDPLSEVTDLIEGFRKKVNEETAKLLPYLNKIEISTLISISDTIAIFTPKVSSVSEIELLCLHAEISQYILKYATIAQYPIRGAITFGEYNVMNNIMIGPGLDECASWHEKGEWIGAFFTPSAQFILDRSDLQLCKCIVKPKMKIPLKNGTPEIEYCILWEVDHNIFGELTQRAKPLLPEIASKYINTYNFLYKEH